MAFSRSGGRPALALRIIITALLASASVFGAAGAASGAGGGPGAGDGQGGSGAFYLPHVPGEILIKFKGSAGPGDRASLRAQVNASRRRTFHSGAEHWRLGAGITAEEAIRRLRRNPHVQYVEPNYLVSTALAPNDPAYSQLYGLHNTGQTGGRPGADVHAEEAWDLMTGSRGVLVAVIDTGIDLHHPDLEANIWTNPGEIPGNGIDDDGNGFVDDVHGWDFVNDDNDPQDDNSHGTHVSGTIGAVGNNGTGVVGVNWNVSLVPLKFLSAGGGGSTADAVQAVEYATRLGVHVMSNSWGGGGFSNALLDAIHAAGAADILFVAAAGNNGANNDFAPFYPSSYDAPNIIAVAATDHNDGRASFSNYGPLSVDLGAPGVNILSTVPGGYGFKSGTSMAAPMVSGAAALLRAVAPGIGVARLKELLLSSADPVPDLMRLTVTGGRLNAYTPLIGQDAAPPGPISDLLAENPTSSSVSLAWTATGDDGANGRAAAYDVRYATTPLDEAGFASASRATGTPAPGPSGAAETMEVQGLSSSTTYYFAVEAVDDFSNHGPLSNVVSATTLPPPTFFSTPSSFSESLFTGQATTRTLTIQNTGIGTLDFRIPAPLLDLPPDTARHDPMDLDGAAPAAGGPSAEAAGGPDLFGYRFVDSDQAGGPAFDWTDLSGSGTPVEDLTGDDQISAPIALGFPFSFYGNTFDTVRVSTNGHVSFTSTATTGSNRPLPGPDAPANLVAPFWSDLDFKGVRRAVFASDGSTFTVQYTDVPRFGGQGTYTFQVSLRDTGEIFFRYLSMTGATNPGTVGLQDGTRTDGLQIAFNQSYIHDRLAVRIVPLPQWLSAFPARGRLRAGESREIAITLDAARLAPGTYQGLLVVESNDPLSSSVPHPVALEVAGAPAIDVAPRAIDFGAVFAGFAAGQPLTITNTGSDDLVVAGIAADDPAVTVDPSSFTLPPGGKAIATVTYAPAAPGALSSTLTIASNASNAPAFGVTLTGLAAPPPQLSVAPAALSETLDSGRMAGRTLQLTNTGGGELVVDLSPEQGSAGLLSLPPPPIVANGGFEIGNFSGWTATSNGRRELQPWMVSRAGGGFFQSSHPLEGTFDALNGFDGDAHLVYRLFQDIGVPSGTVRAELSYYDRIQFDSLGLASTLPRIYEATIEDPNGGVLAVVAHVEVMVSGRPYTDLGWQRRSVDLAPWAGRSVRLMIKETIQEAFTGPGIIEFDAFRIDSTIIPDWLSVRPSHATIPPGSSSDFEVAFDASGSGAAVYQGEIRIDTNGLPATARVPATLTVIPAARIVVTREVVTPVSSRSYSVAGEVTSHPFAVTAPPLGGGAVEMTVAGDYGLPTETATMAVEGTVAGTIGDVGTDCVTTSASFPIDAATLSSAAADGVVEIEVTNSPDVGVFCAVNSHQVRLTYRTAAGPLDFGSFFAGLTRTVRIAVENAGTAVLDVPSIASDLPDFTISAPSLRLAPGTSRTLEVTFAPAHASVFNGTLTILSNDGSAPSVTIPLSGTGLPAPVAGASPPALAATLLEGTKESRTLTLTNDGGSPLTFSLHAVPRASNSAPPVGAAPLPSSTALVTEFSTGELSEVDTATGVVNLIVSGLKGPNKGLVLSPSGSTVYLTESLNGEVVSVDLTTRSKRVLAAGLNFPNGLALSPDGSSLLVTETGTGRLFRLSLLDGSMTTLAQNLAGANGVAVNALGDTAYVAAFGDNELVKVDLATGSVSPVAAGLNGPVAVVLSPTETIAYVAASAGGEVLSIEIATGAVVPIVAGLDDPGSLTLNSDGTVAFVTEFGAGTLDSLNLGTGTVTRVAAGLSGPVGVAFGRPPGFLTLSPAAGAVPPFGSLDVDVAFDSQGLFSGTYLNDIKIATDDPARPLLVVPASLTVIGVPNIRVTGQEISLTSIRTYFFIGALTYHPLPISIAPGGGGSLELVANGDYGDPPEQATLLFEGRVLGSVGSLGADCASASAVFPIDGAALAAAAADGVVEISVQNSINVDTFCPLNNHFVRLSYRGSSDHLDFGPLFAGQRRTLSLVVENTGSEVLDVSSIRSDTAEFVTPLSSVRLQPRTFETLAVDFAPSGIRSFAGILTIASDDADTPVITIPMTGTGTPPPIVSVRPSSLSTTLVEGDQEVQTLDLTNTGLSPLDYSMIVRSHFPGALSVPFAGLSAEAPGASGHPAPAAGAPTPRGTGAAAGPVFQGVPGDFEALNPSVEALSCVVEDPVARLIYAQANNGDAFYRFVGATGAWQRLTSSPVAVGNNCGAAILNGKIYTAYADNGALVGVFDIASSTWTAITGPIGGGTGNIASDGVRFLYLVAGTTFVRYEPAPAIATPLAPPPFAFESWGGLRFLDGVLYGHQGNGLTGFAKYDIAADRWTLLPSLPAGAVLGAAVDPGSREYFAYGSYGGSNLYRYSIDGNVWKVSTIPFFTVNDGGLAWLPGPVPAIYLAQGEGGSQFVRLITARSFVSVASASGTVPPESVIPVDVHFESRGLLTGAYDAGIEIRSNDPRRTSFEVPVRLNVIGVPRLRVSGQPVTVASSLDFAATGGRTAHRLPISVAPSGNGSVDLIADGDFGLPSETATAILEGTTLGSTGGTGIDCTPATASFNLDAGTLAAAAADGIVEIAVLNSSGVGPICAVNRHTVRLRYSGRADRLDFGELFVGQNRTLSILLENVGTEVLRVSAISSDLPEFVPSAGPQGIPPGGSLDVPITFTPRAAGPLAGSLTISSDDAGAPSLAIALTGVGLTPPVIDVRPPSLSSTLLENQDEVRPLTIANLGGSPLQFALHVRFQDAIQGLPGDFENLPPSPAALTCVVEDPSAGILYGQDVSGTGFFRYVAAANAWEPLAGAPIPSPNGCGAALLNGRIYTASTADGSLLGVYDVASNAWSEIFIGLLAGTADIASDGARYLYLATGASFVRFDPTAGFPTPLSPPPFTFEPWGGLRYLDGVLYGHRGNGRTEFARYDIAAGSWTALPPVPGGAVLGAAIDPIEREYFAYGSYGGTSLYRYSIAASSWSAASIPFFGVNDGGLGWLGGVAPGIYFVEGPGGHGFGRLINEPGFVRPDRLSGSIPAFSSTSLQVTFDSVGLGVGVYETSLEITSNDANRPLTVVPAALHVVRQPDIAVTGQPVDLQSSRDYAIPGAQTVHRLALPAPPEGSGSLELIATGDYVGSTKTATLDAEGILRTELSGATSTCGAVSRTIPIGAADLLSLAADGVVEARVQISPDVNVGCPQNNHTVRLRYRGSGRLLDYGPVFSGLRKDLAVVIENRGTEPLEVASIAGDAPEFHPAAAAVTVPPHGSFPLAIAFAPPSAGSFTGHLHILSNDPDTPEISVDLEGRGVAPPVADARPPSIAAALPPNGSMRKTKTLRIGNSGGSDLAWSAALLPSFGAVAPAAGGVPPALGAGGPDASGYLFRDSDHLGGPAFSWIDIRAIGAQAAVSGNNAVSAPIPIGFSFPFYGNSFATVRVCTNGWLSFTSSRVTFLNPGTLPFAGSQVPENLLAPFWDDLDFGAARRVTYYNDGARFIVQFTDVPRLGGGPSFTFQVQLYPSGRIVFQYLTMPGLLNSATIGIQNADKSIGLLAAFNEAYLHDGLALAFDRVPAWVSAGPLTGTIAPGGAAGVDLDFSPSGLGAGSYEAAIALGTSDPFHPSILVPIVLHVGEVALDFAAIDPQALNLRSNGNTVRGVLQLPTLFDPHDVDVATVSAGGLLYANPSPISYSDDNGDGVPELSVKFDRASLAAMLGPGTAVPVTITGEVRDTIWFTGTATVRPIRPQIRQPEAGAYLVAGTTMAITWSPAPWPGPVTYDVALTLDGGATWEPLAGGIGGTSFAWLVGGSPSAHARLRVFALDHGDVMGYDTSAEIVVAPAPAPPDRIDFLDASDDGSGFVLTWRRPAADLAHGPPDHYRILRAAASRGPWMEIGTTPVESFREPPAGAPTAGAFFYKVIPVNAAGEGGD